MTKRITALVLAIIMALSLCGFASATETVGEQESAAKTLLAKLGIMVGYPDGSFGEGDKLTRAQAAKVMAYVVLGEEAAKKLPATGYIFEDVDNNHWAAKYIKFCADKGIIKGIGGDMFKPDDIVKYSQMIAMTLRNMGYGKGGEFEGELWETNVGNVVKTIPTLSVLTVDDIAVPAARGEVANIVYTALFTPFVETAKDASGALVYSPVTTGKLTPADALGVEVVRLGEDLATFKIDGTQLEMSFPIAVAEEFPAAKTEQSEPEEKPVWAVRVILDIVEGKSGPIVGQ